MNLKPMLSRKSQTQETSYCKIPSIRKSQKDQTNLSWQKADKQFPGYRVIGGLPVKRQKGNSWVIEIFSILNVMVVIAMYKFVKTCQTL